MTKLALCAVLTPMILGSTPAFSADTGEVAGGRWLIVHFHYSVPVAGQAIKY